MKATILCGPTVRKWIVLVPLAAWFGYASATKPHNITDGEIALLPPYCPDTMGFKYGDAYSNTSPRAKYWIAQMGQGFWAIHHHCWALANIRRARFMPPNSWARRGTLENARGDFEYVIGNTKPDFVLLPEVYTRLGEVELLLGNIAGGYSAYAQARQLKPDYWPAYSEWAEFLIRSNQKREAKALVELGLAHAPGAKVLADLYRSLGGNPSTVKPIEPPAATASGAAGSTNAAPQATGEKP